MARSIITAGWKLVLLVLLVLIACFGDRMPAQPPPSPPSAPKTVEVTAKTSAPATPTSAAKALVQDTPERVRARLGMVQRQIEARGVSDPRVLAAMRAVPRHAFVREADREFAYTDNPLPIEAHQTISQPYIVAFMTELAHVLKGAKVLEVGTGSGYQAAVLAELGARVYSIEIVAELANSARERLRALGYDVQVRHGDGYAGWPEAAPFDAILVTAAPPSIPAPLREQLAVGGRMVIPVGEDFQDLLVITRTAKGYVQKNVLPVRFVPMTGRAEQH